MQNHEQPGCYAKTPITPNNIHAGPVSRRRIDATIPAACKVPGVRQFRASLPVFVDRADAAKDFSELFFKVTMFPLSFSGTTQY